MHTWRFLLEIASFKLKFKPDAVHFSLIFFALIVDLQGLLRLLINCRLFIVYLSKSFLSDLSHLQTL